VDPGQALAAPHEVEQRLAARRRGRCVLGIVENGPLVLARKSASYAARFFSLMSAGSYVMVVDHAAVLRPISSMVRAASGIDECT